MRTTLVFQPDGVLDPESVRVDGNQIICSVEVDEILPPLEIDEHLTILPSERVALLDGQRVDMPGRCFELLVELAKWPNKVCSKAHLYESVWGWSHGGDAARTRTLDSHASRLRRLLGGRYVCNCWGRGYRLTEPVQEAMA